MLCYVDDALPGITRKRRGRYWQYFDPKGKRITDREEIDRLNAVGLPPAYKDAWFCPSPHGHIQAIGYDDKGRKQYRYHPNFRAQQEAAKYESCASFGRALPLLRARVESDLEGKALSYETVVAAVVRLLDVGHIRVGNESYAKANKSFGATTLRNRHARVQGSTIKLSYRGKSGQSHVLSITDRNLARLAKKCQDLPGQQLFQFIDGEGEPRPVTSTDVNAYIRDAMGEDFTAKHFRTWGASAIAFAQLCGADDKVSLKDVIEPVAEALGNTPAISRKSYVHPALIDALKDNPANPLEGLQCPRATKYLYSAERGLIAFLESLPESKTEAA